MLAASQYLLQHLDQSGGLHSLKLLFLLTLLPERLQSRDHLHWYPLVFIKEHIVKDLSCPKVEPRAWQERTIVGLHAL